MPARQRILPWTLVVGFALWALVTAVGGVGSFLDFVLAVGWGAALLVCGAALYIPFKAARQHTRS